MPEIASLHIDTIPFTNSVPTLAMTGGWMASLQTSRTSSANLCDLCV